MARRLATSVEHGDHGVQADLENVGEAELSAMLDRVVRPSPIESSDELVGLLNAGFVQQDLL